ncbi:hypothetical protein [Streptomyces albidochromogenes]|uniref:hypothetical protein n=1 Tax=Streptomyces albidochromogenes TaxID=329524 RepID=UPI00110FB3EE|nr:hypothetical protein [Streptomyces albidochromogenes]
MVTALKSTDLATGATQTVTPLLTGVVTAVGEGAVTAEHASCPTAICSSTDSLASSSGGPLRLGPNPNSPRVMRILGSGEAPF